MTDLAAVAAPLGVRDILRLRNFRLLWAGQLISEAGEGVIAHQDPAPEPETTQRPIELTDVAGKVRAGEAGDHQACHGRLLGADAGLRLGGRHQTAECDHAGVEPDLLMRDGRAAHGPEQPAIASDERDIRLRVASVDRDDRYPRRGHLSSLSRSPSQPTIDAP